MPAVAVCGVDTISTGHPCDGTALIKGSLQTKVTIGGNPVAVVGDAIEVHEYQVGGVCVPHSVVVNTGSSKVSIATRAMARIDDSADAGAIVSGSSKVTAGG